MLAQNSSLVFHVVDIPSGLTVNKYLEKAKAEDEVVKLDHEQRGFRYRVEERRLAKKTRKVGKK